jgi:hypothetical protein
MSPGCFLYHVYLHNIKMQYVYILELHLPFPFQEMNLEIIHRFVLHLQQRFRHDIFARVLEMLTHERILTNHTGTVHTDNLFRGFMVACIEMTEELCHRVVLK